MCSSDLRRCFDCGFANLIVFLLELNFFEMNALELKGSIFDTIAKVNDLALLEELNQLVRKFIKLKKETDWWDELSECGRGSDRCRYNI